MKKIILLLVGMLVLSLVGCNSASGLQPKIMVGMKAEYFRPPDAKKTGIDQVRIDCPWEGEMGYDMDKLDEDWYVHQAKSLEAPESRAVCYKLRVGDFLIGENFCTKGIYMNGVELYRTQKDSLGITWVLFWLDSTGQVHATSPAE